MNQLTVSHSIFTNQILYETIITYASVIAHDQRSPICAINLVNSMHAELMPLILQICLDAKSRGIPSANLITNKELEEFKDSTNIIKDAISKMNAIIDNSLKHIKNITNNKSLQEDFRIYDIVNDNLSQSALGVLFFGINSNIIHLQIDHKFKYLGNITLINQVITNLVQNALYQIKHIGSGEIFISTEASEKCNILRIKDTAGGASPDVVKNMFKLGFTTKSDGNGIGLDFCKKTMQSFGGDIGVDSKLGEYIEFILTFPKLQNMGIAG